MYRVWLVAMVMARWSSCLSEYKGFEWSLIMSVGVQKEDPVAAVPVPGGTTSSCHARGAFQWKGILKEGPYKFIRKAESEDGNNIFLLYLHLAKGENGVLVWFGPKGADLVPFGETLCK